MVGPVVFSCPFIFQRDPTTSMASRCFYFSKLVEISFDCENISKEIFAPIDLEVKMTVFLLSPNKPNRS